MHIKDSTIWIISLLICLFVLTVGSLTKIDRLNKENAAIPKTVEVVKTVTLQAPAPVKTKALGNFKVTFYTLSAEECGKAPEDWGYGITRSGAYVREGITVAVDPEVIPLGSYVYIEGLGYYVAQDTGGAVKGKVIDVYVDKKETVTKLGGRLLDVPVYLLEG